MPPNQISLIDPPISNPPSFSATLPTATPFPPFLTSIGNDCVEIGKVLDSVVLAAGALAAS